MTLDIQKAVESGKLSKQQGAALEKLSPGTYALHKSWGFGQVEGVDFLVNQMTINFKGKKAHPMQLPYAADSLQPIPNEHILAQKAADLPGVRAQAKENPVAFVHDILQNYGGRITQDQLSGVLVPDVFPEAEFKRWWEAAKKLLKKDGHYAIPSKKSDPILLREAAVSRVDEHLVSFQEARQLKDQITALDRIIKDIEEFTDPATQLQPVVATAEESARRNQRLKTNESLQLVLARDEIVEKTGGKVAAAETPSVAQILREEERQLRTLLAETPAAKLKRVLNDLPTAYPDNWVIKALDFVITGHTRIVADAARLLQDRQKSEELRSGLDRAIRDHSISSAALTWLCDKRERKGEYASLIRPRVLSSMLSALERDQFLESRDRKLHDLIVNDKELITDMIAEATAEELRETMRRLMLSPVFEELNKRALLGRIVRVHPELQSLITGEVQAEKQEALIVSWESLERRKAEYEDLVKKKIPQNTQEIAIARDHGDLRENFEFKAAKEMQRVLMRRQAETERELQLARGTDFANPDTTSVSIGTIVKLRDAEGKEETYTILGAWDSDPDKGVISYQAAIAQALIGHKVGEKLSVPTETGERQVEILSIQPWKLAAA